MTERQQGQPDDRPGPAARPLSRAGIDAENRFLLRRYREFRLAADAVTAAWRAHPYVVTVSLIGSLARDPWKEVPRFQPWRRAGIALWHECKDVDLALWLADLTDLNGLRRARAKRCRTCCAETISASRAIRSTSSFSNREPTVISVAYATSMPARRARRECRVPGCGEVAFLRQHDRLRLAPDSLAGDRAVRLFDRAMGTTRLAADLPLPGDPMPEAAP